MESSDYDENKTLEILKEKPLLATEIREKLTIDQGTLYKMIRRMEKKQLLKVGYKRTGRIQAVALCYLPEQGNALKAGYYGMIYLPIETVPEIKPIANLEEVTDILANIDNAISNKNWDMSLSWMEELRQICQHKQTGARASMYI